jgi:hypothetical protein
LKESFTGWNVNGVLSIFSAYYLRKCGFLSYCKYQPTCSKFYILGEGEIKLKAKFKKETIADSKTEHVEHV